MRGTLGNLKFDAAPDVGQLKSGRAWRAALAKPVLLLASSREGEELALLQNLKSFWPSALIDHAQTATESVVKQVQWLIVPRHPQRFAAVADLIEAQGFGVSRRSTWHAAGPSATPDPAPRIWLGDSLGEMALYYALADAALLGGSIEPLGGQNLIEAAACGCPVLMGPHTFNFAEAAEQAQAAGAAQSVADLAHGISAAAALVQDAPGLLARQQACQHFAQSHRGTALRLAQAIEQVLLATSHRQQDHR